MTIKFNNSQRGLLGAAARREDRCLLPPMGPKLAVAKRAAAKLVEAGLVKETPVHKTMPIWRRDEATRESVALKVTAAGRKAIAVDSNEDDTGGGKAARRTKIATRAPSRTTGSAVATVEVDTGEPVSAPVGTPQEPRVGSKSEAVTSMLRAARGATIEEIVASTGWLPHSTRAALTGLRKRGFVVVLDRSDRVRGSSYRIASHVGASPVSVPAPAVDGKLGSESGKETGRAPCRSAKGRARRAA